MESRYSPVKIFIATVTVALMIILLNAFNRTDWLKGFLYRLFKYPEEILSNTSFAASGVFKLVSDLKNWHNERVLLIEENNQLKKEVFELKEARRENDLLRSALSLPLTSTHPIIDAEVIAKDPYSFFNFLMVSRGSESNIKSGMAAVDSKGFFVGRVSEVHSNTAKIRTIADSDIGIAAIDQESRVQGLVKNDLGAGLIFDMVAADEKVGVGDTIITSPSARNVSSAPIAKVISIEKSPNKPFQQIKLFPLADIKNIEKIFIILD